MLNVILAWLSVWYQKSYQLSFADINQTSAKVA